MKLAEAEQWLQQQLGNFYEDGEKNAITSWVFEKVTGLRRIDRIGKRDEPLHVDQLHQLNDILQRLSVHEPVQYVLGEAYFHGLKLYVDANVLIPRPETEELVEWIIKDSIVNEPITNNWSKGNPNETHSLKILDVGTGSGCIALALKQSLPKAEVWGCDVSNAALNVSRRNSSLLNISVEFKQVNIIDTQQWNNLPLFDIIVSNPPYIAWAEQETMHANVLHHEPHIALFVPDEDSLLFYKVLSQFAAEKLHYGGALYVEIHEARANDVIQLFQTPIYRDVLLRKDMQGKDRMIKAIKAN